MEYNPMEEMGFVEDKQFISNCHGFISKNNNAKSLCSRFIRDGDRFFDVISRYDDLTAYALDRDDNRGGAALKMIVPFLRASGVSDHVAYKFSKENLELVPGADRTMKYIYELLPTFITTGSFEHHMMSVCDAIDFPMTNVSCTQVPFDSIILDRQEAKTLREIATKISSLRVPKTLYTITNAKALEKDDAKIVSELDKIFVDTLPAMQIDKGIKTVIPIGSNEKAYSLLEIRRKTEIEFNSTVYIGGDITDHQALDLVRDSDGLAMSYNGSEYAVRGCNVAVMSTNTVVATLLTTEFYNEGIEAVFEMIDNWDRKKLETCPCADRHLMNTMLKLFPRKLPVVKKVDRHNVDEVVIESENFRKKNLK